VSVAAAATEAPVRASGELARSIVGDEEALRLAMAGHGYVFVRGLVPPDDLAALDAAQRTILLGAGWASGGPGGRLHPEAAGAAEAATLVSSRPVQRALFSCEALHRVAHHPRLLALLGALLDTSAVLRHPRPVARVAFPQSLGGALPTPPHQDHVGMQGATETYTAWIALESCGREDGALAVAEGSHLGGIRPLRKVAGARVFCCAAEGLEDSWRSADFDPGDVVVFHSHTVHAALANRSGALRRSVDCRYQRAADPVCEVSLREEGDLHWEEVYAGWGSAELERYWEALPLQVVPFDPSLARS